MRRHLSSVSALALLLAFGSAPLSAQVHALYPGQITNGPGKLLWNGVNSSMSSGCVASNYSSVNGVCTGPYSAKFSFGAAAPTPTGPAYDIFCVDFNHEAYTNTSIAHDTYFSNLTSDLSNTRAGNAGLTKYEEAAWLASHFNSGNQSSWHGIHGAIWYIVQGVPVPDGDMTTWINLANTAAANNFYGYDFSQWALATPTDEHTEGQSQEFLIHTVVPEPASLLLMGSGLFITLFGMGVLRRPEA